jgi:hypothetical protein
MTIRNGAFVSNLCGGWLVLELCEKIMVIFEFIPYIK